MSTLAKGGGEKKRFEYCLSPNSLNQFLYLRAIQGHPGSSIIGLLLQDNVLLPEGFTEYMSALIKNLEEPSQAQTVKRIRDKEKNETLQTYCCAFCPSGRS